VTRDAELPWFSECSNRAAARRMSLERRSVHEARGHLLATLRLPTRDFPQIIDARLKQGVYSRPNVGRAPSVPVAQDCAHRP
jgi:hypothetical protein